jgi:raffinose/stachyose/melibiose transport system substrate-binding protein
MQVARKKKMLAIPAVLVTASMLAAACGSSGSSTSSGGSSGSKVTIKAVLPPGTGTITSSYNTALNQITQQYEKAHSNVTVDWQPNPTSSITTANATLVTEASGGDDPDVVFEQYNPLLSGSIPAGILQNLKSYLEAPDPYLPGKEKFIDSFDTSTVPYMTSPNGQMQILLGSNVETAFYYNKADFAKAGISGPPSSWAQFMSDLAALKAKSGVTPLMFAYGGPCNPSWYERLADTQFLNKELSKFMVDKSVVTSGKDVASGIVNNVISMSNPAYAEVWKMLYALKPYISTGGGSYDACSAVNAVSPPLNPNSLFVQNKVAILWNGSWAIPELNGDGMTGKYGLFAEPTVTAATSPYSAAVSTKGVIGGPNGSGQWSITSEKADKSMTPAKTKVVMNFMEWLFTPAHIGAEVKGWGQGGSYIPTIKGAPVPNVAGLASLVPAKQPPTVVDIALDDVLSTNTTNAGLRLVDQLLSGGVSFSSFSTQWEALLKTGAQAYATQNKFNLNSLKK